MSTQFQIRDFDADRYDEMVEAYVQAVKNGDLDGIETYQAVIQQWEDEWAEQGEK